MFAIGICMFNAHAHSRSMRRSPLRHTLAVLRTTIGLGQKEMAELLGCSTRTIQAIELGQLQLSLKLGEKITYETGVSLSWLMHGNPDNPIVADPANDDYTKEDFEEHRANLTENVTVDDCERAGVMFLVTSLVGDLFGIYAAATRAGKQRLCNYKMHKAMAQIQKELGLEDLPRDIQAAYVGTLKTGFEVNTKRFTVKALTDAFWSEMDKAWTERDRAAKRKPKRPA